MFTFNMNFIETGLKGAYIIDIVKEEDEVGFSGIAFSQHIFLEYGLKTAMVQANTSYSKLKGTLRGLHLQLPPFEETKVVCCTRGSIYDVIIDLRPQSPTYKKWIGVELTANNYKMLYVPDGFAHGYLTLEDECVASYYVSEKYTPGYEIGIRWNDPAFNLEWPLTPVVVSEKDNSHPDFSESTSLHNISIEKAS